MGNHSQHISFNSLIHWRQIRICTLSCKLFKFIKIISLIFRWVFTIMGIWFSQRNKVFSVLMVFFFLRVKYWFIFNFCRGLILGFSEFLSPMSYIRCSLFLRKFADYNDETLILSRCCSIFGVQFLCHFVVSEWL